VDYVELDEHEERLALASMDSITGLAGRDAEKVRDLIASQVTPSNDALAKMFAANLDLNAMIRLGQEHAHGEATRDADHLPPERETTIKPGDILALGPHRLMCGDCTKREDVNELVANAEKADMMFTDPPYGVNYGSSNKQNAIRGDITQAEIPISFNVSLDVLDDNARIYVCGGQTNVQMYWKLWDHHLHAQPHLIVWVKDSFVMRSNNYHSQFELIYYGWKGVGGGAGFWFGERTDSDVWHVARDADRFHPTQKPVALVEKAITNSCPEHGLIYEPFAGSGATLIAAERLHRRCYAMEIDRAWCQRIVDRWEGLTGEKARLLGES
jgi:DNA modification methylase